MLPAVTKPASGTAGDRVEVRVVFGDEEILVRQEPPGSKEPR
jgi:hypothetical protein